MLRDGRGGSLIKQFLIGQIMPGGAGVGSDVVGQFGGSVGELAKAEQVAAAAPVKMGFGDALMQSYNPLERYKQMFNTAKGAGQGVARLFGGP